MEVAALLARGEPRSSPAAGGIATIDFAEFEVSRAVWLFPSTAAPGTPSPAGSEGGSDERDNEGEGEEEHDDAEGIPANDFSGLVSGILRDPSPWDAEGQWEEEWDDAGWDDHLGLDNPLWEQIDALSTGSSSARSNLRYVRNRVFDDAASRPDVDAPLASAAAASSRGRAMECASGSTSNPTKVRSSGCWRMIAEACPPAPMVPST